MTGLDYAKKHIDLMFSIGKPGVMNLRHISRTYGCDLQITTDYYKARAAKPDPCRLDEIGEGK